MENFDSFDKMAQLYKSGRYEDALVSCDYSATNDPINHHWNVLDLCRLGDMLVQYK